MTLFCIIGTDKKLSASGPSPTAVATPVVSNPGDIDRLRRAVQVLVQHTGPLGTSIDFIQEDIGLMTAELRRWEEDCRKSEIELDAQKQKTAQVLKPLIAELNELEEQVRLASTCMPFASIFLTYFLIRSRTNFPKYLGQRRQYLETRSV
jgi:hypothetical protein